MNVSIHSLKHERTMKSVWIRKVLFGLSVCVGIALLSGCFKEYFLEFSPGTVEDFKLISSEKSYLDNRLTSAIVKQDIYFVETSGKNYLENRQLASLESIARFVHHDNIIVYMFTKEPIEYNDAMTALKTTYGVRFEVAEFLPFFVGTPLELWYNSSVWQKGRFRTEHCSDAMRGALMWKKGGIFMDLDIIMIKETSFTKPSVLWEPGKTTLASFLMVFSSHHELMRLFVTEFKRKYDPVIYHANGPLLMNNVYKMYKKWLNDTGRVNDVVELNPEAMQTCPRWEEAVKFFDESATEEMIGRETRETVGVHIWNSANKHIRVKTDSKCAYIHYVKNSSPIVYAEMLKVGTV